MGGVLRSSFVEEGRECHLNNELRNLDVVAYVVLEALE
jgi:hypothetical protein